MTEIRVTFNQFKVVEEIVYFVHRDLTLKFRTGSRRWEIEGFCLSVGSVGFRLAKHNNDPISAHNTKKISEQLKRGVIHNPVHTCIHVGKEFVDVGNIVNKYTEKKDIKKLIESFHNNPPSTVGVVAGAWRE